MQFVDSVWKKIKQTQLNVKIEELCTALTALNPRRYNQRACEIQLKINHRLNYNYCGKTWHESSTCWLKNRLCECCNKPGHNTEKCKWRQQTVSYNMLDTCPVTKLAIKRVIQLKIVTVQNLFQGPPINNSLKIRKTDGDQLNSSWWDWFSRKKNKMNY